jgi:hypothetical protein
MEEKKNENKIRVGFLITNVAEGRGMKEIWDEVFVKLMETGIKKGEEAYFYAISGEANASLWNPILTEMEEKVFEYLTSYNHIVGPVVAKERDGKCMLLEIKKKYPTKVNLFLSSFRQLWHWCMYIIRENKRIKKGALIFELPHTPLEEDENRKRGIITLKENDTTLRNETIATFEWLIEEFKTEKAFCKEITKEEDIILMENEKIKNIVEELKNEGRNVYTLTGEEIVKRKK